MNDTDVVSLQFKNSVTGSKKLEEYEKRLKSIKLAIESLPSGVKITTQDVQNADSVNKNVKNIGDNANKAKSMFSTGVNIATIKAIGYAITSLTQTMSKFTEKSADYVENLNLLNVAYHRTEDTINEVNLAGEKLINTLSDMYGMDESSLMRTVGIFKQLSNAMGLSDKIGNQLTKTLTQMSIDVSSLYNVSFERASSVLQSSLAGQTKPIRGLAGADITETTLQVTLDTLGIDRTVRDLSYVEKRLIIVTSLIDQLKESQNDYGKTIESVSNQMRVFNEQVSRLTRALGNVFLPILQKILPYINGFLMVLTEIINMFAIFLGFDEGMLAGFATTSDSVLDLEDSLDGANESAKKLKKSLRGFDKLNVITTPANESGSGLGVDADILNAFMNASTEYEEKLEKIQMKATRVRNTIMEWLGFTKLVDEETGKVSFKFDHITSGTVLGTLAVGGTIYNGISKIYKFLNKIGLLKFPGLKTIKDIISGINKGSVSKLFSGASLSTISGLTIGILGWGLAIKDAWQNSDNFRRSLGELKTAFDRFMSVASEKLSPLFKSITEFYSATLEPFVDVAKIGLQNIYTNVIEFLKLQLNVSIDGITTSLNILTKLLEGDFSGALKIASSWFDTLGEDIEEFLINIGIPVNGIKNTFSNVVKTLNTIKEGDWKTAWKGFSTVVTDVFNGLKNLIKTPINAIIGFMETMVNAVITGVNAAIKALNKVSVKIPNWVPQYGGKSFGFDIKTVKSIQIPRLKTGLDFVPNDFYGPVYLDYGERVLTKEENQDYMKGNITNINSSTTKSIVSPTIIVKVGDEELARKVLKNLQDMATANGEPIEIGG